MDLDIDLTFIPTFKRFQVSGVRAEALGSRVLTPETIYPQVGIKLEKHL